MDIQVKVQLSDKEKNAALAIVKECNQVDLSYRIPYLDNNYNDNPNMPAFVLAFEDEALVAFLTIYADEPHEAEVSIYVAPSYRCQGIANALLSEFKKIAKRYQLIKVHYVSETNFLDQHPDFWNEYSTNLEENEIWLEQDSCQFYLEDLSDIEVALADLSLISDIANFQSQEFGSTLTCAEKYAREAVLDETCRLYVLRKDGRVRASCSVDVSLGTNYLFGLAVEKGYQGQGLGSYLVKYILNDLHKINGRLCQIVVEVVNTGALRLYQRLGFEKKSEIVYLERKDN
jgi:acetyltransferase, GNAT family